MKKSLYTLLVAQLFFIGIFGQSLPKVAPTNDNILFGAMGDELARGKKELSLPGAPAISFISYTVAEVSYVSAESSMGSLLNLTIRPKERFSAVNLYLGDSKFSSDYSYSWSPLFLRGYTTIDNSYPQIRRALWQTTDIAYKLAVEVYKSKKNSIKTAGLSEKEKALHDLMPLDSIVVMTPHLNHFDCSGDRYTTLANDLSAAFNNHPNLYGTSVTIEGIESVNYNISSEGTKIKEPVSYVAVKTVAKVKGKRDSELKYERVLYAKDFESLPCVDSLKSFVGAFVNDVEKFAKASKIEEYYLGPVLFLGDACANLYKENLITPGGIMSFRRPIQVMATIARPENVSHAKSIKPLEDRVGKKVVDSRLSIFNLTDEGSYKGLPLIGSYKIDAQGVIPQKRVSIVEQGILKSLISTRIPTKTNAHSTGGLRFGTSFRSLSVAQAPGSVVIESKGGVSLDSLKSLLISSAVEEGLEYAYIIKEISPASGQVLYKIDVKSGIITMVTGAEITPVPLSKLKRVLGVGSTQKVYNFLYSDAIPCSLVYPDGLLIEDVEIN